MHFLCFSYASSSPITHKFSGGAFEGFEDPEQANSKQRRGGKVVFIEDMDGVRIQFCRFNTVRQAFHGAALNSLLMNHNHFSNTSADTVVVSQWIETINDLHFPGPSSQNLIVASNSFYEVPFYAERDAAVPRSIKITSDSHWLNTDPLASYPGRHFRITVSNNTFLESHCTTIDIIKICKSALISNNLIQLTNVNSANEPITHGGIWPYPTGDYLNDAGTEQILIAANSINNERDEAGSILQTIQTKNAHIWGNQVKGGANSIWIGYRYFTPDPDDNPKRIHQNVSVNAHMAQLQPTHTGSAVMLARGSVPLSTQVKNVTLHDMAIDPNYGNVVVHGGDLLPSEDEKRNVRLVQDWQPCNVIPGKVLYLEDSAGQTRVGISDAARLIQPRNFFTAHFKPSAPGTHTLNGMLAFADPDGNYPMRQLFGSTDQQPDVDGWIDTDANADPAASFTGMRCIHDRVGSTDRHYACLTASASISGSAQVVQIPPHVVLCAAHAIDSVGVAKPVVGMPVAQYNTGLFRMGDLYIWQRLDGRLGVKEIITSPSADVPASDTDGTVIPVQAETVDPLDVNDSWETIGLRLNELLENLRASDLIADSTV